MVGSTVVEMVEKMVGLLVAVMVALLGQKMVGQMADTSVDLTARP